MFTENEDPLLYDTIEQLWILARGNFDLVEEAIIASLQQKNHIIKPTDWTVDILKAAEYIKKHRGELESIKTEELHND